MRVLHLSKTDAGGGAADGFVRIHRALLAEGVPSVAYVMKHRRREVPHLVDASRLLGTPARLRWAISRAWAKRHRLVRTPIGVYDFDAEATFPSAPIIHHARALADRWDLVLVHWPGAFLRVETIGAIADALGARIALWQVDMAHVTGGCHADRGCGRYRTGCGACPLLRSTDPQDISARQLAHRARFWQGRDAVVLAPSGWSARQAAESVSVRDLARHVIPIPIDLSVFRPADDVTALRRSLGLPLEGRILLARAIDPALPYKGFAILLEALRLVDEARVPLHVALVGDRGRIPRPFRHLTVTELGPQQGDAAMARAYQACDALVSPSLNETGPMMIGEAMACGRPVVAFPIGIAPDLITSGQDGTLVAPTGDAAALATAVQALLTLSPEALLARQRAAAEAAARLLSTATFVDRLREGLRS